MKTFSAVLFGIVLFFVLAQGASATTTQQIWRPVCSINASSYSVRLGSTVNLTWSSQYATGGTITSLGSVALYGSQGVIPTGEGTTYVGTFTGPGGTGTCSVRVSIILNDGGGGDIDTSGDDEIDTSGTIDNAGTVDKAGTVNKPGTLGAPPVQNAAPIMPGGSGGSSGGGAGKQLVPCDGIDCQACKLAELGQNIINFLVGISIPLAAVMFAYAGFIYFSSSVIDKIEKAHKIFTSVLIGFAIVIGGYLIVETILHAIINKTYFESWNQIKCVDNNLRKTNATIEELLRGLSVTNNGSTSTGGGGGGGGGGGTGTNGASGNDLDNRNILRDNGITVSSTGNCADQNNSNCTSLNGLQSSALSGAIDMGYNCGCSLNVSGGTETGHENGQYSHANGYKLDFSFNSNLDNYIQGWTNTGNRRGDNAPTYTSGNTVCAKEGNHWDCQFK